MNSITGEVLRSARTCIRQCEQLLLDEGTYELIVVRLDSLVTAVASIQEESTIIWAESVLELLDCAIQLLVSFLDSETTSACRSVGRPKIHVPVSNIEYMLSLRFSAFDVARFYGVSKDTIFRRLRENGMSVKSTYSDITDENLQLKIADILNNFPNTGYKRMKGFLLAEGYKLTDVRVRTAMRIVDPHGVYQRTLSNRAIVRRQYNVTYFNQLWHLDTNMKLIRWNIVIRSCIDGKTRLVVYRHASGDNRAETNCISFLKAVATYGIPSRTRSDKGGENVLIARYMLEQRGVERASHICGRSVHNQRIKRYWKDVFYGYTGAIYNVLTTLEGDGFLNIDNPKHIHVVHKVFLPRINQHLETFRNAWNQHPMSSERNYSPTQLMILHLPPLDHDMDLNEDDIRDIHFICKAYEDLEHMVTNPEGIDSIVSPTLDSQSLSEDELERLSMVDVLRDSSILGYDIFVDAISCLNTQ